MSCSGLYIYFDFYTAIILLPYLTKFCMFNMFVILRMMMSFIMAPMSPRKGQKRAKYDILPPRGGVRLNQNPMPI